LALALPAIFYLQLFLNPKVSNLKQYAGERIGFGIFNGAPAFMLHATFYDASPFIVGVLLLTALVMLRRVSGWARLAVALLAVPFAWPGFLELGNWNLSLILFAGVLFLLIGRAQRDSPVTGLLWLWLFAYFIVYAFVIRSAGLHFYTLMPALMLLASLALPSAFTGSVFTWRAAGPALAVYGLLLLCSWGYAYVAYLREQPAYALNYPRTALPVFPTLYHERPRDFFFGFPYRYGWSVIGALYRAGTLRGKFVTNETYLVTDWYVRDIEAAGPDEPRYYFRVDDAPRGGDVPPDLDAHFHAWGQVQLYGEPRIRIYESNAYPPASLRVFDAAQFPPVDPDLLARSIAYRRAKGDDIAFHDLGRYLDKTLSDRDVLVLDSPFQDGIVPYYYHGAARIVAGPPSPALADTLSGAPLIYASLWGDGETERWLAQHAFPVESRWFGSVRLQTYAPALANPGSTGADIHFGDSVRLVSYGVGPKLATAGDVLRVSLRWRAVAPLTTRYKVFVHVLDAQGKVVAQRDAEPMADLSPTTSWIAGQMIDDLHGIRLPPVVAPQSLRLAVGLYDPETNERLPVTGADGSPSPDGQLLIAGVVVQ
jgi:hypothetical protein